jgi:excisionase family DNA binding protein
MAFRDGRRGGLAPFGYSWSEDRTLVPDPAEAPIRKLIAELFLQERRTKTVAKILEDRGHRTRSGARFSDTTVRRLLGEQAPGIIPMELWERCNDLLDQRRSGLRLGKRTTHLLGGLVFCQCGAKMQGPSNSAKFVCPACSRKIPVHDLEIIAAGRIGQVQLSDELGSLSTHWPILTRPEKRRIIEQLVERIVVGVDSVDLSLNQLVSSPEIGAEGQRSVEIPKTDLTPAPPPRPPRGKPKRVITSVPRDQETLTLREAACLLRLSESRVRMMIADGRLPSFRTGIGSRARIRVWRRDLEAAASENFRPQANPEEAARVEEEIQAIVRERLRIKR